MSNEHLIPHVNRHEVKIAVVIIFLILVFVIIYTSVFGGFPSIGKTIMGDSSDSNDTSSKILISADFEKIPLSLDGKFLQVRLRGSSNSFLHVGTEKFSLEASENSIIMDEFDGDISFDFYEISELKGRVSQISINGVPVLPSSRDTVKIYFEKPFDYNSIEIDEGVYIKEIKYKTSGEIRIGEEKTLINFNDEEMIIREFEGSLKVRDKMNFEGYIESLEKKGSHSISIFSE